MTICFNCGHKSILERNVYGTICMGCYCFIPPNDKPQFVKRAIEKKTKMRNAALEVVRNKIRQDLDNGRI